MNAYFYGKMLPNHQLIAAAPMNYSTVKNCAYINGKWVNASKGQFFKVFNPANGQCLADVPNLGVEDVSEAIDVAEKAFQSWSNKPGKERSQFLRKWFNIITENSESIAKILSEESGKPFNEALGEVQYGNSFVEWFSEEARRINGEILSSPVSTRELMHIKQPVGVAALITPWNFPLAMITRKAGAALAAGCTCVIKPAEDTPLTALALMECAEKAGIPVGVLNVVPCDRSNAASVGQLLCENPKVGVITFTGSTAVGKLLYKQCSGSVKRIALELGGNAPFIVFKSADLKKAVLGAVGAKFRNCGQTCVSPNRFLIENAIFDEFVNAITSYIKENITFDSQSSGKMQIGPLINKAQLNKIDNIVQDAIKKGAKVHIGGKRASDVGELFYEPTVLTNITPDMICYNEEIFGPVISCTKFSDEDEAIKVANATNSGLAGYFFSKDVSQIFRVSKKIQVGMVGINEGLISTAEAAFGGVKESGLGREGSHHGIEEFVNVKYLCFGDL